MSTSHLVHAYKCITYGYKTYTWGMLNLEQIKILKWKPRYIMQILFFISKVSIRTQTYLCASSQRILPKVISVWFVRYYHYGKKVELRKRKKGSMINEHLFKKMFTYYSCLSVSRTRNLCSALLNKSYSNDFLLSCMLGWVLYTEVFFGFN